jgi:four helix bundle protein
MDLERKAQLNEAFRQRTKAAALRVIKLYEALPAFQGAAQVLGKQLLRSATSVAINYRAVCRARSKAEFFAKLCICVEEADETVGWLELLAEANLIEPVRLMDLLQEYTEITAQLAKSRNSVSSH